jgi:diguanylate cyclase (GGDEF)-like protein/PAS domain S-box-containing protein
MDRLTEKDDPMKIVESDLERASPLELLLVEDNPGDARLVTTYLRRSLDRDVRITHTSTLGEASERVREHHPDLVLLDLGLPDSRGIDAVRGIQSVNGTAPIVVLTGHDDERMALEALQEGAQDYLVKDELDSEVLKRSIRYSLERHQASCQLERARQAAQAERALSRSILRSLLEHVAVLDEEGTIVAANEAWTGFARDNGGDLHGYRGQNYLRAAEAADDERAREMLRGMKAVLAGDREAFAMEYPCHGPDVERWFLASVAPLKESTGGVVVSHVDITDRKRAEEEVRLERERFAEVFRTAPASVATFRGPDHVVEMVNPACRELVGDRELEGRTVRRALPELGGQGFLDLLDRVYRTGEAAEVEEAPLVLEPAGGGPIERKYVSFVYHPRWEGGRVAGVFAHGVDVTEQVVARKRIEEAEARWSTVLETMTEAVVILDRQGNLEFANPAAEEILGLEISDLEGRTYADPDWKITGPEGQEFPDELLPFRRVMETGEPVSGVEHAVVRGDGERITLSVNAAPITDGNGRPRSVVASFRDVTERSRMEEDLRYRALHDNLTGLPNRTLGIERLQQAVGQARRRGEALGVMIVDVDRFKRINDSLGHTAGDRVLQTVARRLAAAVREGDTVARWGGDEFLLVLPDVGCRAEMGRIGERVRRELSEPCPVAEESLTLEASMGGVLVCTGEPGWSVGAEAAPEELVRYADAALLEAKGAGGSGYGLFDPAGKSKVGGVLQREQELRRGLEADEFEPFFQPIVSLEDGTIWGVEPLARWRRPDGEVIAPADFIALAEETGMIGELGRSIVHQSLEQLAAWTRDGLGSELRVTPNVSGRQFEEEGIIRDLREGLASTGLSASRVHLEVTETSIMKATDRIEELRSLGARVWIDDFGTGYSSFVYLRDLEVDGLKVDMSFVQGLGRATGNRAIIESILTLGDEMGLHVIAEGIETRDQLGILRQMGCGLGQGYLFGRPLPAREMTNLLEEGGGKMDLARP